MDVSQKILARLSQGDSLIRCSGLTPAAQAYLLTQLLRQEPKRSYVLIAPHTKNALALQQDLQFFLGPAADQPVILFPPLDALPYSGLSSHPELLCERIKALWALREARTPIILITTPVALTEPLLPRDQLTSLTLEVGETMPRELLLEQLPEWGYQNAPLVTELGNFAVRGGIIDLYSPLYELPIRIEWMGDLVESIRLFDPKTQTSTGDKMKSAALIPVRETLLTASHRTLFASQLRARAETRDIPKTVWGPLIEKIKEGIPFPGVETYLPCFYQTTTYLWDWLPAKAVLMRGNVQDVLEDYQLEMQALQPAQHALLDRAEIRLEPSQLMQRLSTYQQIELVDQQDRPETLNFPLETHEAIRPELEQARRTAHPLAPLTQRLQTWLDTDPVYLVTSSDAQAGRISDLLQGLPAGSFVEHQFSEVNRSTKLRIVVGHLSNGFRLPGQINLITEEEIFGLKVRRPSRLKKGVFDFSSLSSLKLGDPVVHNEQGICLYKGLIHLTIDDIANDFVLLEFRDGDKLYLPVYRMNLIGRYVGGENPRLDKMGGGSWVAVKQKAQKAIQEMAGELLQLYAARTVGKGFAYSPPNETFEAFEASFPFEETPDQEKAIQDVLHDMESEQPMDRLVLGDVGYGKTEVAMRAAFKAVLDGRQVALLVPTTLLAFQHYERFLDRFKDYPVTIDMLSRFRSTAEQKATVQKIAQGKIDILIGTHRILQPDLSFKNLGLLVIDEEHRFGVSHKEKIKRLRKNIDVLALSATPIPRTLHMSLIGMRPISVIETPPVDRLAIRTYVTPFEDQVLREAILREIKRGGQVFFVHNQIETIMGMKEQLQQLVPDIKIEIAHGQMDEEILETIMIRFFHHEFDLLLCTTIIESGIDIPTANTIIINRAERLGLAQIYQLRGRVGRSGHRAYAYLVVSDQETLTPTATQRLSVLQRYSELGSGFKMASYDLEIRGAGTLLGEKQSGQMAALGYELYSEILSDAIRKLKGEEVLESIDPEFHFRLPAYLPESYVNEPAIRLDLYLRLASLDQEEEIDAITEELTDRFGPSPVEVTNLLEISALKTHAKKLRIKQIRYDGRSFVYAFDVSSPLAPDRLLERIKRQPKKFRLTPDFRFIVQEPWDKPELALVAAKKLLRDLVLHI